MQGGLWELQRACSRCLSARGNVFESPSGLSRCGAPLVPHIVLALSLPDVEVWHMWFEILAMLFLLLRDLLREGFQIELCGPSLCGQGSY